MRRNKRNLPRILLFAMLLWVGATLFALSASAEILVGECGAEGAYVTWSLDTDTGRLIIEGEGAMADYGYHRLPWTSDLVTSVTIKEGVTSVGAMAFEDGAMRTVTIPSTMQSIEYGAFSGCSQLECILYGGSPAQWAAVRVGEDNEAVADDSVLCLNTACFLAEEDRTYRKLPFVDNQYRIDLDILQNFDNLVIRGLAEIRYGDARLSEISSFSYCLNAESIVTVPYADAVVDFIPLSDAAGGVLFELALPLNLGYGSHRLEVYVNYASGNSAKIVDGTQFFIDHEHIAGTPATCVADEVCTICGQVTTPALGHNPGPETTCAAPQRCTRCAMVLVPALPHTYGAPATCTADQICMVCSGVLVPKLGHTPGAPATCTADGTCQVCDAILEAKRPHDLVLDERVNPTCQATGLTEGARCATCRAVLIPQVVIDKVAHTPGLGATCTSAQRCTACHSVLAPMTEHSPHIDSAVGATCTRTGLTEGSHCAVCNTTLTAQTEIPKTAHTPGAAATCTTDRTCTVCHDVLEEKHGHTFGKEATCTTDQLCTVCGSILAAKTGHTSALDPKVAATCLAEGLTEGAHCSTCKAVLIAQTVIPKTAHTSGAAATCTTDQTCSVCGDVLKTKHGHTPGEQLIQEPSTKKKAGTTVRICTSCGATVERRTMEEPKGCKSALGIGVLPWLLFLSPILGRKTKREDE